jgi:hypothetical protein
MGAGPFFGHRILKVIGGIAACAVFCYSGTIEVSYALGETTQDLPYVVGLG